MTTDVSVVRDGTKMPGAVARVPKYYRVKQQVVEITESLTPGERLPAERSLALRLDTSRTTVLQALQQLVGEGRSDRIQGKGTFIARPKLYRMLHLTSCTEDMPSQRAAACLAHHRHASHQRRRGAVETAHHRHR
ncbi:GntR family transcriptional regulator [Streptomyces sp. ECR3.8]|uniref:GntR family transcriptional regulator n=1 Tax=Streptomyces sp. ECR3.8 TaxID=3461009 RepID=UPI004042C746